MDFLSILVNALIFLIPIGLIAAIPIYISTRRSAAKAKLEREAQFALSANAVVIAKRTQVSGYNDSTSTAYFVTFDIEGIGRAEFNVAGNISGLLVEGDRVILRYLTNPLRLVNFDLPESTQQFQQ